MVHTTFWSKVDKTGDCWIWLSSKSEKGYGVFYAGGRTIRAHRVAWELVNGPIPRGMLLDHKCHRPSCVNPSHMRIASNTENQYNSKRRIDNASGLKGVFWDKTTSKWRAMIRANGRRYFLGRYATRDEAYLSYCAAAARLHGEFANYG